MDTFEAFIVITGAIILLACYIMLKTTGVMWYGINWNYIARCFRRFIRKLFR